MSAVSFEKSLNPLVNNYRIVFTWVDGNAENVEIVDYH